jgi:hypothetical protein
MNDIALQARRDAQHFPDLPPVKGFQPIALSGMAEKISNACGAQELAIALFAADAWVQNSCRGKKLPLEKSMDISQRVQQTLRDAYHAKHSPVFIATLVGEEIERAVAAA